MDFKDSNNMSNLGNMKTSKDVLDILQNHYPGKRLKKIYELIGQSRWVKR